MSIHIPIHILQNMPILICIPIFLCIPIHRNGPHEHWQALCIFVTFSLSPFPGGRFRLHMRALACDLLNAVSDSAAALQRQRCDAAAPPVRCYSLPPPVTPTYVCPICVYIYMNMCVCVYICGKHISHSYAQCMYI